MIFKILLYVKVHILHTLSFIVLQKAVYKYNPRFIIDIVLITRHATYGNEAKIVLGSFLVAMSIFDLLIMYMYFVTTNLFQKIKAWIRFLKIKQSK